MKKVMALVMAAAMTTGILAGCGGTDANNNASEGNSSNNSSNNENNNSNNDSSDEDSSASGEIILKETGGKLETVNPHLSASSAEASVHNYMSGSLLKMVVNEAGDNYEILPYHAASIPTMSEDGLTWTFEIRDGLAFADGTEINADTYEYSYKMLLDPKLLNLNGPSMFSDVTILNAEKYFNGECGWEEVGIKIDGNKLTFQLEYPVAEMDFLMMFTGGSTCPVNPEIYETCFNDDKTENSYGTSLEKSASSGPYTLTTWTRDQVREFEKNENTPHAEIFTPDKIHSRVVEDATTSLQLFESGEVDFISVSGENYTKYEEDPRIVYGDQATVWYMYLNQISEENPVLQDVNFRQALYYAMDRSTISDTIFTPSKPAPYYVADCKVGVDGVKYRDTEQAKAVVPENNGYDPDLALEYFNKAYEANGNKKIEVEMMYFDSSDNMKKTSEFLEESYENLFGKDRFDIKLVATPAQQLYENMENGDFQIGYGAWVGGEFNPWSTMKVHTSMQNPKHERFFNEEFDELWKRTCQGDLIFAKEEKIDALARMEELIYEEMPMVPIHQPISAYLFSDRIILPSGGDYIPGIENFGVIQAEFKN